MEVEDRRSTEERYRKRRNAVSEVNRNQEKNDIKRQTERVRFDQHYEGNLMGILLLPTTTLWEGKAKMYHSPLRQTGRRQEETAKI